VRLPRRRVQADAVLNVNLFDFDAASQLDSWMEELEEEDTPESESYGLFIGRDLDGAALDALLDGALQA
jgi:hypothetical protein